MKHDCFISFVSITLEGNNVKAYRKNSQLFSYFFHEVFILMELPLLPFFFDFFPVITG